MLTIKQLKIKIKQILISKNIPKINSYFGLNGTGLIVGNNCKYTCGFDCVGGGSDNKIILGDNVNLANCYVYIGGSNNTIEIGNGSYIGDATFWIEDSNNKISIGKGASVNVNCNFTVCDGHEIKIGDGCLISTDVCFQCGDGHSVVDKDGTRINFTRDIVLGNHVWIGKE